MKTNKTQTEKAKYILKGQNGQLYVYEDKIEITRKGIAAFAFQGLKGKKHYFSTKNTNKTKRTVSP